MKPTRQFKPHTAKRRKEAKKAKFAGSKMEDRFKMIYNQRNPEDMRMLFSQLAWEDRLEFLTLFYKGVKVKYILRPREGLNFSPMRIVHFGFSLDVYPIIKGIWLHVKLADYGIPGPGNEVILKQIQRYLPTVKVL